MDKFATHAAGQGRALIRAPWASGGATGMGRLPAHSLPPLTVKAAQPREMHRKGSVQETLWFFAQRQPVPKPGIPETPGHCFLPLYPNPQKPQRVCCGKNVGLEIRRPVPFSHLCPLPVGSSPDSSEGHFAHLWNEAAGLDLYDPEGSR